MKVLVTGCSGYIGGQTAIHLKETGHEVYGLDRRPLPIHLTSLDLFSGFSEHDFSHKDTLDWVTYVNPDAIIHCAGTSLVGPSISDPAEYYNNNFIKTKIMLDHLRHTGWRGRFIFSSSAATYGTPIITPCQEVDPTDPISPYGQSKLMIEWMLKSYENAYGIDYVAFRYFNACGADPLARHGQESGATHIIARILENFKTGKDFICNGNDYETPDGTCIRDYVHVSDIASAHVYGLDQKVTTGVYNLGSSQGYSNLEVMKTAIQVLNHDFNCQYGPRREGDPAVLTADPEKFTNLTGWKPKYNLREIIEHAWAWYNV